MQDLAPVIASVTFFFVIAWIVNVSLAHRRHVKLTQLQHDLQVKLLDKVTTTGELSDYLHGDVGRRFLESATVERTSPHARILSSIQVALVLLTGGAAFLLLEGRIAEADEAFAFLGTLGVALGVGFGLSAAVAYALSRAWGLMNAPEGTASERS